MQYNKGMITGGMAFHAPVDGTGWKMSVTYLVACTFCQGSESELLGIVEGTYNMEE